MSEQITAKEFLIEMFNLDFMTSAEVDTIEKAMELYAMGKCNELQSSLTKANDRVKVLEDVLNQIMESYSTYDHLLRFDVNIVRRALNSNQD